ncbi:xanthine dehydrogenase accessory factor [Octadecabacter temperatus]|uniref:XdhC and CoxI family protein n=1 Tax=Octadecabacter temperatus TaxID=1458307 RepID=A0A0K0Y9A6_9RHOB|nr:XdhC family protein [Octadecabacter temperatus]AKS47476.1 XdhC and CoxI family protein [Octadecabacter temperatus]SIO42284.1 xanthine dehydrogenase accessory factor [Octadecabacter temperatus]
MQTFPPEGITYTEHAADIVSKASELIKSGRRFALITSVGIEGGAARDVGSLALVSDDDRMTGYLSNGCIDRDIQHHAMGALETGQKALIRYGDGSRYADLKLPCGGALDVLIDPNPDLNALLNAKQSFQRRCPVTLAFRSEETGSPTYQFTYAPPFRLYLAGRGAIFRAAAKAGHAAGFDICLLSPEAEDLAAVNHLASIPPVHLTSPDKVAAMDALDEHSAFLTLFHDHDWEPSLLKAALQTKASFIGSLGSRRTHAMRCETLRQIGVSDDELARLRGPIGLVPSLRNASFIAISALAEIVGNCPASIQQAGDIWPAEFEGVQRNG